MPTYVLSKVKRTSSSQKTGDLVDQDHPAAALETLDTEDEFLVLDVTGDAKVFKVITRAHMIAQLNGLIDAKWGRITGKPSTFVPSAHTHAYSAITGTPPNASTTARGLVELATPTEALDGTDSSRAMTAAGVRSVRDALLSSPPAALDTLNELAAALGDDANFSATIASQIAARGTNANDLSKGTVNPARMGSGTGDTKFLRRDGSWAELPFKGTGICLEELLSVRRAALRSATEVTFTLSSATRIGIVIGATRTAGDRDNERLRLQLKIGAAGYLEKLLPVTPTGVAIAKTYFFEASANTVYSMRLNHSYSSGGAQPSYSDLYVFAFPCA